MTKMEKDSPIYRHCIDSVSNLFKEEGGEDPKIYKFPHEILLKPSSLSILIYMFFVTCVTKIFHSNKKNQLHTT